MSKAKTGTYLVLFEDGTQLITGNNYKAWWEHMNDYFYREYRYHEGYKSDEQIIAGVDYSPVPFVDDGGLKWASVKDYQEIIDEEAARLHQTFTPLKDIKFKYSYRDTEKLRKEYAKL